MLADFILPGILVGVGSAASPGPMMLLVISETLRGGVRSGFSVSIAPLLTDIPFVILSVLLATSIASFQWLVGVIALVGAGFLLILAWQNVRVRREDLMRPASASHSLVKGVTLNLVNPYLYIFWFSVALPVFARGNMVGSAYFAAALLLSVVATQMTLAILVAFIRRGFVEYLHLIIRVLSLFLVLVALMFIREGIGFFT